MFVPSSRKSCKLLPVVRIVAGHRRFLNGMHPFLSVRNVLDQWDPFSFVVGCKRGKKYFGGPAVEFTCSGLTLRKKNDVFTLALCVAKA
jgi:hypothetical protein